MSTTCTKLYSDLPFAHRQHMHGGHCAYIHGHNWGFEFTFAASELDECGFVVDFGKLKWLKEWLNGMFDHTLLLNEGDPALSYLTDGLTSRSGCPSGIESLFPFANIRVVPDASCEGLARYVFNKVAAMLVNVHGSRVWLVSVKVTEDAKNSATYTSATYTP